MEVHKGGEIISIVGRYEILACEVSGRVNELLEKNKDRIPASQVEMQRKLLTQQLLKNLIETKLIYNDARRTIPEENFPQVEKSLAEQFDKVELKNLMERAKVETRQELEATLLAMGSSLQRERRAFAERTLTRQWFRQQIKPNEEITVDEMWAYYNEHVADFQKSGRVRWQQLTARFSKHPNKQAAYAAIGQMGNRVLARMPMDEVAKAESNGTTASNGGWRDWTAQDSLVSKVLDQALFELPAGQLSPILEDATGYHIVRVIEREDASQTPFPDAQADIRPKITQRRIQEQMQAYLAKLRKNTPVWTIFDKPDDQRISNRPDQRRW
ncbi:MAG: peptidyl-prolyl cis-trans isomerase [Candidatus Nealsonbacteria bacterium]|nr:peptidyl-prolyl cis-trans isomerase [Candidatus Nealsonbacteria bacterium]